MSQYQPLCWKEFKIVSENPTDLKGNQEEQKAVYQIVSWFSIELPEQYANNTKKMSRQHIMNDIVWPNLHFSRDLNDYRYKGILGKGRYSVVALFRSESTLHDIAVKFMNPKNRSETNASPPDEWKMGMLFKQANIHIGFYEYCPMFQAIIQTATHVNLKEYMLCVLTHPNTTVRESAMNWIFVELRTLLKKMKKARLIHGDLHLKNIRMDWDLPLSQQSNQERFKDAKLKLLLIDFGKSTNVFVSSYQMFQQARQYEFAQFLWGLVYMFELAMLKPEFSKQTITDSFTRFYNRLIDFSNEQLSDTKVQFPSMPIDIAQLKSYRETLDEMRTLFYRRYLDDIYKMVGQERVKGVSLPVYGDPDTLETARQFLEVGDDDTRSSSARSSNSSGRPSTYSTKRLSRLFSFD